MERFEKSDESRGFRRTEIFSVSRHIAAALDNLANQLVFGLDHCSVVQGGTSLATFVAERMTIPTLLKLKDERTLAFKSRTVLQELTRNGVAAPCIHNG